MANPTDAIKLLPWLLIFVTLTLTMASLWRMHLSSEHVASLQHKTDTILKKLHKVQSSYPWRDAAAIDAALVAAITTEAPTEEEFAAAEEGITTNPTLITTEAPEPPKPPADEQQGGAAASLAQMEKETDALLKIVNNRKRGDEREEQVQHPTTTTRARGGDDDDGPVPGRDHDDGDKKSSRNNKKKKFAILMHSLKAGYGSSTPQPNSQWLYHLAYSNHKHYAEKWGYDFIVEDEDEVSGMDRDGAWAKLILLKKWLPDYEWILYVDQLVLIQNFGISIEDMIKEGQGSSSEAEVFLPRQYDGNPCTLMLLVKHTDYTRAMLSDWFDVPQRWWGQQEVSALHFLLNSRKTKDAHKGLVKWIPAKSSISFDAKLTADKALTHTFIYQSGFFAVGLERCFKSPVECRRVAITYYSLAARSNGLGAKTISRQIPKKQLPDGTRKR